MLEFNGVSLPDPDTIKYEYAEAVKERETLSGRTVRLVLRRKEHIACSWQQLSASESAIVLAATAVDSGTLRAWSQKEARYVTRTVYVAGDAGGDITAGRRINADGFATVNAINIIFREA